jgi:HD-GYP domain-containing protein (c-di-GMP phosphodiesterase class II)
MLERRRIRLIYIVLGMLLVVGLLPLGLAGWSLSGRSALELRATENRYQAQLVQDKARQIELYGQRYKDVVSGLARAFELAGGQSILLSEGSELRLKKMLQEDPNIIALLIQPVEGKPHRAFQPDVIKLEEVEERVGDVLSKINGRGLIFSRPQVIHSGQEIGMTIASPVMGGENGEQVVAAVVAIVSFQEVFSSVQQTTSKSEQELLDAGLPVVFVVDPEGRAVAHPDQRVAFSERPMTHLKVVQDWVEEGSKTAAALSPFIVERDGKKIDMLGSYATANIGGTYPLGVIAIQDESAALASVTDMRRQTVIISFAAALCAILIGIIFAKGLTKPVNDLAQAASKIAAGDFTQRIKVRSLTELGELGESFNVMAGKVEDYIADIQRASNENRQLFLGTIKALAAAIDGKDPYTRGHSERVSRFSVAMAERLGLPDDEVEKIRISALLHDVGKIGIDDNILKKPAALTNEEYEIMKQHPQKGYKIMSQIPAMKDFLPGMYMHHEMIDGRGYPQGLKGDEIPMQARIVSVADTFDAMTTDRPYSRALKIEEALKIIQSYVGTRYDERVVAALVTACEDGQIRAGSVKLNRKPSNANSQPQPTVTSQPNTSNVTISVS